MEGAAVFCGTFFCAFRRGMPWNHLHVPLLWHVGSDMRLFPHHPYALRRPRFSAPFQKSTDVVGDLEPVTVTFLYQANGRYRRLTMPLIMLVPVPYLQIDAVDFSFKATVTTCSKGSLKAIYMRGNVSTSATSEVQAKNYIDIQMRATPASLPSGISKLIELMSNDMAVLANEEWRCNRADTPGENMDFSGYRASPSQFTFTIHSAVSLCSLYQNQQRKIFLYYNIIKKRRSFRQFYDLKSLVNS